MFGTWSDLFGLRQYFFTLFLAPLECSLGPYLFPPSGKVGGLPSPFEVFQTPYGVCLLFNSPSLLQRHPP